MTTMRIPKLTGTTRSAAASWINRLHKKGLLFCLDDDPADIVKTADGEPMFPQSDVDKLNEIVGHLYTAIGDEIHELAFEAVSKTFHTRPERRAFRKTGD